MVATVVVEKSVNIYQYPASTSSDNLGFLAIGDLHGNAVKLLYFLLRHRVVKFKDDNQKSVLFNKFVKLYFESNTIIAPITTDVADCTIALANLKNRLSDKSKELEVLNKQLRESYVTNAQDIADLKILTKKINNAGKNCTAILKNITEKEQEIEALNERTQLANVQLTPLITLLKKIISELEIDNPASLLLIGDDLFDRGSNDSLTLWLIEFLVAQNIPIDILISNHSNEFILAYEQQFTQTPNFIRGNQKNSFTNFEFLVKQGLIDTASISKTIKESYLPRLKVLDYRFKEDGIIIFTHAPVEFDLIKLLATKLGVKYKDSTPIELAQTIDAINRSFSQVVKRNEVQKYLNIPDIAKSYEQIDFDEATMSDTQKQEHPLIAVLWNRWNDTKDSNSESRPSRHENYEITWVHGHDPHISTHEHIVNLDTDLGKGMAPDNDEKMQDAKRIIDTNNPRYRDARDYIDNHNRYIVFTGHNHNFVFSPLTVTQRALALSTISGLFCLAATLGVLAVGLGLTASTIIAVPLTVGILLFAVTATAAVSLSSIASTAYAMITQTPTQVRLETVQDESTEQSSAACPEGEESSEGNSIRSGL